MSQNKIKPCKWHDGCLIKEYADKGKLERYWIESDCLAGNKNCRRYQLEESGECHPDAMLPDGTVLENLGQEEDRHD